MTTRKNFPSRVRSRRQVALNNLEKSVELNKGFLNKPMSMQPRPTDETKLLIADKESQIEILKKRITRD